MLLLWSLLVIFASASEEADWLTLRAPSAIFEGDRIDLICQGKQTREIQTMAYYKDGKKLHFSNEVFSFSIPSAVLSDSGSYSCSATVRIYLRYYSKKSNSIKIQVQGTRGYRRDRITARVLGALCGGLGFIVAVLLLYCGFHKVSGGHSATDAPRDASSANPQGSIRPSSLPDTEELQPEYVNANIRRTILENKDSHVIYSNIKET
uniref:Ig-like domain-containing protein n=1 Tax=Canis lupus familiaris TaxID=9615 RepID=A0A8C0SVV8_CANLF